MLTNYFSRLYDILKTNNKDVITHTSYFSDIKINYNNKHFIIYYMYLNYFSIFNESIKKDKFIKIGVKNNSKNKNKINKKP